MKAIAAISNTLLDICRSITPFSLTMTLIRAIVMAQSKIARWLPEPRNDS